MLNVITSLKWEIRIFIGKYVWHTMRNFSDDCVVLVLASDYFNESDYIRDYDEFLNTINKDKI